MAPRSKQQGFTLIEVLVVILILGLMASIVFPRVTGRAEKARVAQCRIQIHALANALENYHFDNGVYPSTEQGLDALISQPTGDPVPANWQLGGYLQTTHLPKDPWNNAFAYFCPGPDNKPYEIISYGRDGKPGGAEAVDRDISVWDSAEN